MSNIRVDVGSTIRDGTAVAFRSPVDCSAITGLIVYYPDMDGNETAKEFALADAHGNNVGDIDHLFAENVVVKVILDVTAGMAFVQNADTNAYLEGRFAELSKGANAFVGVANETAYVQFSEARATGKACFLNYENKLYIMSGYGTGPASGRPFVFYAHNPITGELEKASLNRYGGVTLSTIEVGSGGGGESNVFLGTTETTYAEFSEAKNAGKVCFLETNSGYIPMVGLDNSGARFSLYDPQINRLACKVLGVDNAWSTTLIPVIKTVNGKAPNSAGDVTIEVGSGGTVTDEQIASAVEDYMAEHPVIPGATVEPAEDDIPKVFFGGALQQTKTEAVVPFRYISKTQDFSGYAEIKAQGNSSMGYPKKNQTVKLFKDADCTEKLKVDFKGWGEQNKHVYKANWIDLTHARNVVSARLWGDVVKSRSNYAELPELLRTTPNQGAMDGFPVKVYADGVYQGRYTLNIPKDKWAFNMDDGLDEHCVLCGENYVSGCFRASANINESDWTDEIHDTVPASIKTRWNQVISFVMNSTDTDFRANLNQYFYVDSLIDYYLFGLASCGLDAFGKNQIYATYDGQRWIASMYDMDSTWGLYWNGSKFVATDYARTSYEDYVSTSASGEGNLLYNRLEQLFYEELQARWAELKNGALSIENIINRFERFTDIAPAELVKEDYASTTGGGKFTSIPSQSTNNIQQIRAFALARLAWTDEYVTGLIPEIPVPCTGVTLSAETLTFTAEGTQTLTATVTPDGCTEPITWESNNTSVATVNGGVVTARANGNATIIVRCGNYSASCSVSVSGIGTVEPSELPSSYSELPYIQSTGEQYIDTGVSGGTNASYEIKFDSLGTFAAAWEQYLAGSKTSTIPKIYNSNYGIFGITAADVLLSAQKSGANVYKYNADGSFEMNGNVAFTKTEQAGNGWGDLTWYVFNSHGEPNLMASMKLYYLKMWTDGVIVRDFIPVKRNEDGAIGLYDLVNGQFYENEGSGSFSYIPCTGIILDKTELVFDDYGARTLTATVTPEGLTDEVTWESDNNRVATAEGGVVTAVGNGTATITATCGSYSASCTVTVSIPDDENAEYLYTNFSPNGESFVSSVDIDWAAGDYIEAEIDVTNCTGGSNLENVLSVGLNIAEWDGGNAHVYCRPSTKELNLAYVSGGSGSQRLVTNDSSVLHCKITSEAISVNDNTFLASEATNSNGTNTVNAWLQSNTIQIGSAEGAVRSTATYNYIKVVRAAS